MTATRRQALRTLGAAGAVGLGGCLGGPGSTGESADAGDDTTTAGTETDEASVTAAFVYHDAVGDFGWQWAHDQGRRAIDDAFDWLETEIFDNVKANGAERRFEQIAERGYDVIFGTSFDYRDALLAAATAYPDVRFEHCSGYSQRENLAGYFGRMYQPRYLTGVAAGLLTDADELGYVAAFPNSEVVRGINAFALGAAAVNDDVTVRVEYTDSWNDVDRERTAANFLLDDGVDVMAQHQNYPAVAKTAAEAGVWATGYNSPMGELVGDRYVTSPIWNWDVFYHQVVREIHRGTWTADFYWKGLESGVVDLSAWGPQVPEDVRETVARKRRALEQGDIGVWTGSKFANYDDESLYKSVRSYVDKVAGEVPS